MKPSIEMKGIPGFPGYWACADGRIWSEPKGGGAMPLHSGKFLRPYGNRDGYLRVGLWLNGKKYKCHVHRLVLESWIGPHLIGYEANHKDNDPGNNRPNNLEWATHQQNEDHKVGQGRQSKGESDGINKLTQIQVLEIRRLLNHEVPQTQIAHQFGVSQSQISNIKLGKNWSWLGGTI